MLAVLHEKVQENIKIAQGWQKVDFECRHAVKITDVVKEGDEVLMAANKKATKLGSGLKKRWVGPFRVESLSDKGVATIVEESAGCSKRRQKVNVRHLKPYHRRAVTTSSPVVSLEAPVALEADLGKLTYFVNKQLLTVFWVGLSDANAMGRSSVPIRTSSDIWLKNVALAVHIASGFFVFLGKNNMQLCLGVGYAMFLGFFIL